MVRFDKEYNKLCRHLLEEGVFIYNERTGKNCLTLPNWVFFHHAEDSFPMITTRKCFSRSAMGEIFGYWNGLTNAGGFRKLGAKTWDANANLNKSWLSNPNRKGEDDMGEVYGAVGHNFNGIDQFKKVYTDLKDHKDDRGEIITYWKPDVFNMGCLRPCLHTLQFTSIGGVLNLQATQRSCDVPLGLVFNAVQVKFMLCLMAKITNHEVGEITHVVNLPHVYEDQIPMLKEQMKRNPIDCDPTLTIPDRIKSWEDIESIKTKEDFRDFKIEGYSSHENISFPFSE